MLLLVVLAIAACSTTGSRSAAASLPPVSASPAVVLDSYLRALVVGDCDMGRKLAMGTFRKGNGELCGETRVTAYQVQSDPAHPSSDEVVFATTLTTTGTADHSIEAGRMVWFYSLDRQPDGSWRIVGGGSGP